MPMTCRAVRQAHQAYKFNSTLIKLSKIFQINEPLAAEQSISKHVVRDLQKALKDEKKRQTRGKQLNILEIEDSGSQFYFSAKVQTAREFQSTKKVTEVLRCLNIVEKKQLTIAKKEKKRKKRVERLRVAVES